MFSQLSKIAIENEDKAHQRCKIATKELLDITMNSKENGPNEGEYYKSEEGYRRIR